MLCLKTRGTGVLEKGTPHKVDQEPLVRIRTRFVCKAEVYTTRQSTASQSPIAVRDEYYKEHISV